MRHGWRILTLLCCGVLLSWAWLAAPPLLTRGPYLQSPTATGITLVCKTSSAAALTLSYGEKAGRPWQGEATSASGTTHVFDLTGLRPETRYEYELSADGTRLGNGTGSFRTSPPAASRAPFRFLAWGDSGNGDAGQLAVAARMLEVKPAPTFALGLGDLVYENGEWENYDPNLFEPYATLFRSTTFWPAIGNHDVRTQNGAPYLDAFYMSTQTGAPGHPSGSELYYSFDHGMAHFTCLDSELSGTDPSDAQYQWLVDDLDDARARGKRWLFVYMHHPPYSRGTHDSTSEGELITLHDNLVPVFDEKQVDMVLVGHSHVYERSFLAKSDAALQSDAAEYTKIGSPDGTIYLVSGCGGETGSGPLDHPLMSRGFGNVRGFSVIDVGWSELRGRFVEDDGRTTDLFTVRKAADVEAPEVALVEARGTSEVALVFDEPVQAGAGAAGAENVANYTLGPSGAVTSATLDTDQSTVVLGTTPLTDNSLYTLDVASVADPAGHGADARVGFVHTVDASLAEDDVVPRGATWRYFPGSSAPPASWANPGFDDSSWAHGPAGFGFADSDDATVLVMQNVYASVYARITFAIADPDAVSALALNVSYDDGFVAFLNGTEVARARVPAGQTNTTLATSSHEAGTFEPFDVDPALLVLGTNVLAVQGHNAGLNNGDFSLHPELVVSLDAAGGPPRAVPYAHVRTANAPASIPFSAAGSSDDDGPLVAYTWDFGDGSASASGVEVTHLYTAPGSYTATLIVRDGAGNEAVETLAIRIHSQGDAPSAQLAAGSTDVPTGTDVTFGSAGSLDPDGGGVTLHWDFGDPGSGPDNVSSAAAPTHRFATAGTYRVTLVVTDDEGSSTTETADITVSGGGGGPGGGGGGGGGCSIADVRRPRGGDAVLAAILGLVVLRLLRGRLARRKSALHSA